MNKNNVSIFSLFLLSICGVLVYVIPIVSVHGDARVGGNLNRFITG